jgi:hypothetical protein
MLDRIARAIGARTVLRLDWRAEDLDGSSTLGMPRLPRSWLPN